MLNFAKGEGALRAIPTQGYIKEIHIKTKTGWIRCFGGDCS
ncbi:hypothetical protein QTQ03_28905 [Micromonospora sp. WMMA1363]|nr:hypothetical protein [Micromonospora sp. WMMA1363]MDM4721391.1 hypothetical protein [Micromonospora sp. WMMA1363]MDM4723414.1 hypothetical protein [Micromonospora sp. WMMA1363]MDM4723415.1 hypothetical protein [Micromonospora sp. WMMA1363]